MISAARVPCIDNAESGRKKKMCKSIVSLVYVCINCVDKPAYGAQTDVLTRARVCVHQGPECANIESFAGFRNEVYRVLWTMCMCAIYLYIWLPPIRNRDITDRKARREMMKKKTHFFLFDLFLFKSHSPFSPIRFYFVAFIFSIFFFRSFVCLSSLFTWHAVQLSSAQCTRFSCRTLFFFLFFFFLCVVAVAHDWFLDRSFNQSANAWFGVQCTLHQKTCTNAKDLNTVRIYIHFELVHISFCSYIISYIMSVQTAHAPALYMPVPRTLYLHIQSRSPYFIYIYTIFCVCCGLIVLIAKCGYSQLYVRAVVCVWKV